MSNVLAEDKHHQIVALGGLGWSLRRIERTTGVRTRAGMKAALELGRWVFLAPLGYLKAPRASGSSLMPDPERAPIVRRVFEAYATGRFTKQRVLEQARAWGLRTAGIVR